MRDPLPYGVTCLMAMHFLKLKLPLIAAATMWMFDTYCRSSEASALMKVDILPPAPAAGPLYKDKWIMILGNSETGARTKTKIVDGGVEVGGSVRPYMKKVAQLLYTSNGGKHPLFGTGQLALEAHFRTATRALDLEALHPCPHMLRHGGASEDFLSGARNLAEIKKRGLWESLASVSRYAKSGLVLRQLNKLPVTLQRRCRTAEHQLPAALISALEKLG